MYYNLIKVYLLEVLFMSKPNIILITTDQMRGDCLGIAGHKDVKTPYLDSLATQGVLFNNAYTATPSCIPARAALLTGQSQKNHKRVGYADGVTWDYDVTLPKELTKAGYQTKCVGKMHVHPLRNNCGFEDIDLHDGYLGFYRKAKTPYYENQRVSDDYFYWLKNECGIDADVSATGIECNSWVARPWIYDEEKHPTNWVVRKSMDFLRKRDRSRPFFLMASFVRPHPPFDAPQCYFDMYKDKKLEPPVVGDWANKEFYKKWGRVYDSSEGIADPELLRQAQVGYYACITHIDHQIGRLIQTLQDEGVWDNTIIIFTSDHGELLGDHNTFRKSRPYQGSVNIPMILWASGGILKKGSIEHNEVVELRDILPTLLDVAKTDIPSCVDGDSMISLINEPDKSWREYIHGEHSGGNISNHFIVTEKDKYIWYSQTGIEQYFDLEKDPKEIKNLVDDEKHIERINYLRQILINELKDREEGYVENNELVVGKQPKAVLSK